MVEVLTVDPVSVNLEFSAETGIAADNLIISVESGDEPKLRSVSGKKVVASRLIGSIDYTVSSEVFESGVTILKNVKLISVFFRVQW